MEGLNAAGLRMSYSEKYLIFNTKKDRWNLYWLSNFEVRITSFKEMHSLLVGCAMQSVQPWAHIYTSKTKMGSAGCIYVYTYIYM